MSTGESGLLSHEPVTVGENAQTEIHEATSGSIEGRGAAFFDLDGTLLPMPSLELRFWRTLRSARTIPPANHFAWIWEMFRRLPRGRAAAMQANKRYLRGVPTESATQQASSGSVDLFLPEFFPHGIDRVEWHARQGHRIVLVSGTIRPLALRAAAALRAKLCERGRDAVVHVCATQLEESGSKWSGQVVGDAMFEQEKARAARRLATQWNLDLARCSAYGDSEQDRWLLASVGNAFAVNPRPGLARLAQMYGWPVLRWEHAATEKTSTKRHHRESSRVAPVPNGDAT